MSSLSTKNGCYVIKLKFLKRIRLKKFNEKSKADIKFKLGRENFKYVCREMYEGKHLYL